MLKDSVGLENEDTTELIKSFAKNLPKNSDLFKLLQNTLKLDEKKEGENDKKPQKEKPGHEIKPFLPQRFPSFFKVHNHQEGIRAIKLPKNGEKTIKFDTDVENDYFDRIDDPGDLEISLLQFRRNDATGGTEAGDNTDISGLLNITKSSPNQGTIKLSLSPRGELQVGDQVEIKVSLSAPGEPLEEILLVKIADNEAPKEKALQEKEEDDSIGLPALEKVHKDNWEQLEGNGIAMDHDTVKNIQFGVRQRFVHSFFVCKVRHYALLNSCAKYCISTNTNLVGGLLGGLSGGEECSTSCSSVRVLKSAAECVFGQKKNLRNRLIL